MPAPRRRAPDTGNALSPQTVVESALALADAEGLGALSIRRLAGELEVTPMALYWHFRNKDGLLDAMAADAFDQLTLPASDTASPWDHQLRALLQDMVGALRVHPCAAGLLTTRTVTTQRSLRVIEYLLDLLHRGGFTPPQATQVARHALHTVAALVSSRSGVVARPEREDASDARSQAQQVLQALPPEEYPRLIEAAIPLSRSVHPEDHDRFGLDLLLAGITAMAAHR